MKVILLKSVPKVGKKDDIVEVSDGFAANALLPQKLAVIATPAAIAKRDRAHQNSAADKEIRRNLLDRAISALEGSDLVLKARANEQGTLFSKIDQKAIAEFLESKHRISIDPNGISIPGGAIKRLGTETITITDGSYRATIELTIAL